MSMTPEKKAKYGPRAMRFENIPRKHSPEDLARFTEEELEEIDFLEDLARADEAIWEATEK